MAAIWNFQIFRKNCKTQKMLVSRKQRDRANLPKFLTHRHDYAAIISPFREALFCKRSSSYILLIKRPVRGAYLFSCKFN